MVAVKRTAASSSSNLLILGVGGAGGNAIECLASSGLNAVNLQLGKADMFSGDGIEEMRQLQFVTIEVDSSVNRTCGRSPTHVPTGSPYALLHDVKQLVIIAGMGGRVGSDAAPKIACTARQIGIQTSAIAVTPFRFEGSARRVVAAAGLTKLQRNVDELFVISNDLWLRKLGDHGTQEDLFDRINDAVLRCLQLRLRSQIFVTASDT